MRLVKITLAVSAVVTACAVLGVAAGYLHSRTLQTPPTIDGTEVLSDPIHLGEPFQLQVTSTSPWRYGRPKEIEFEPPDGIDVLRSDEIITLRKLGFGTWTWTRALTLQVYDFGPYTDLTADILFHPHGADDVHRVTAVLPDITITPKVPDKTNVIHTADELSDDYLKGDGAVSRWWLLVPLLVLVAVACGYMVFRRSRGAAHAPPPPPWTVAETALYDLEDRLPLDAETVFVELTDITRRYIEAAYQLPATERTTPEFLRELNREKSRLGTDQRLMLADFLSAADMVKFARLDASESQIRDAIGKAKRFISESAAPLITAAKLGDAAIREKD